MPATHDGQSAMFAALAHPVRAQMLRELRRPRILADIVVREPAADGRGRPLARQTIRAHLDQLLEAGLVIARETYATRGPTLEYVVDHKVLFALSERLREWASRRPEVDIGGETVPMGTVAAPSLTGDGLVLVRGLDEGRLFPLDRAGTSSRWVIGRAEDADIRLDYDPFVSHHHAVIEQGKDAFRVRDLEGSLNGTWHNFEPLPKAGWVTLAPGDVIIVGHSSLLLRVGAASAGRLRHATPPATPIRP